jgi:hypothetical protein
MELPVIDITHPAFMLREGSGIGLTEKGFSALWRLAGKALSPWFRDRSLLARGMKRADGAYLDGMSTYLMKLGPENLGKGYARALDRRIAASELAISLRLRLRDMASFLADGTAPLLGARPGAPIHLVNIGGGPSMDSLNALILLARGGAPLLPRRRITVHVLDLDPDGPAFGARALAALQSEGGPLSGLDVSFRYEPYDWRDGAKLRGYLESCNREEAVMTGSSEGAMFSYASDREISENLEAIRGATPDGFCMACSVARSDREAGRPSKRRGPALRPRGWEDLQEILVSKGWVPTRIGGTSFSRHFLLVKA